MTENIVSSFNESINNSVKKVQKDLETLPSKVGEGADIVSEGSNYVAIGGIIAAPFTGGSSLTLTGYALTLGTYADVTSAFAKGIDALAFSGSKGAFERQVGVATLSSLGGFGVNKLFGRVVTRTSSSVLGPAYRSTTSGRFVSNGYGFSLQGANYAARIALTIGF